VVLGKWSYSIYLVHFAVLALLKRNGWSENFTAGNASSLIFLFLVLALSAGIASLTHRFIEVPGISKGEQIIARWRHAPT
jgi:peptidoglycan/LPS O-acetylase OafA/YrhL